MLLSIDDQIKVDAIQDTFNECFPYLKIELFKNLKDFKNDIAVEGSYLLGDVRSIHDRGILELKSWFSAEDVQQLFKKRYGMLVKVYRNENNKWVLLKNNDSLRLNDTSGKEYNTSKAEKSNDDEEVRMEIPS
jgi:hypothetical protein